MALHHRLQFKCYFILIFINFYESQSWVENFLNKLNYKLENKPTVELCRDKLLYLIFSDEWTDLFTIKLIEMLH